MKSPFVLFIEFLVRCALIGVLAVLAYGAPVLVLMMLAPSAQADFVKTPGAELVRSFVQQQLSNAAKDAPADVHQRVEVEVGKVDPRITLKTCSALEPFLPPTNRLWGKTFVGLRCTESAGWTVFVPVQIKVFVPIAVANHALHTGDVIALSDLSFEEREVTQLPTGAVTDPAQVAQRVLMRGFMPGQPIMLQALRSNPVVSTGDAVKVVVAGEGFSIASSGVALAQAEAGQSVRVRLESGKTLQGIAWQGRIVEVKL
jgi:flagella basal body P-ring formation protein FlgA